MKLRRWQRRTRKNAIKPGKGCASKKKKEASGEDKEEDGNEDDDENDEAPRKKSKNLMDRLCEKMKSFADDKKRGSISLKEASKDDLRTALAKKKEEVQNERKQVTDKKPEKGKGSLLNRIKARKTEANDDPDEDDEEDDDEDSDKKKKDQKKTWAQTLP